MSPVSKKILVYLLSIQNNNIEAQIFLKYYFTTFQFRSRDLPMVMGNSRQQTPRRLR